ncbi:hypothetical protein L873DRAFT_87601 [Choiromyces venosus 120613-1]|uniref:PiggyBac transposable element-derived protein domain-containing protein n=1 Tax=Choiromyces venosus 120613-1 TaxID=1336337 RepID=A0A3N4K015_9PEZI|nr:hypothetical protein L873DRAFT_87601 [Choiromyces venosus 120613-1]
MAMVRVLFTNCFYPGYTTHQRAQRNWLAFLYFFLDLLATNAHILLNLARNEELNRLLDTSQLIENDILSHPLARPIPAAEFRQALFKDLGRRRPKERISRKVRVQSRSSTHHISKTSRIYFTKNSHTRGLPAKSPSSPTHTDILATTPNHCLERMEKRRECCICRYDFRNGQKAGRSRPKLTQFECQTCSPPCALCGGNEPCFARWHNVVQMR